jgi:hypothetical protein
LADGAGATFRHARAGRATVAFAISQPEDVDTNDILSRAARQEI